MTFETDSEDQPGLTGGVARAWRRSIVRGVVGVPAAYTIGGRPGSGAMGAACVGRSADEKPGLAVLGRRQDGPVPGGEAGRDAPAVAVLARETGVSFTGLRLRDGSLVLKPKRGRRVEQLWIIDGDSFDCLTSAPMGQISLIITQHSEVRDE